MLFRILLISNLICDIALATPSARRAPFEPWQKTFRAIAPLTSDRSALAVAQPYRDDVETSNLPEWNGSLQELTVLANQIRDERQYRDAKHRGFLRRTTHLYPYDGCYARAEHTSRGFAKAHRPRPGKVLAFGDLVFETLVGPKLTVFWSYHVAPAYRIGKDVYVIDPVAAISRPLPMKEWLGLMTEDLATLKIAVCDENAYSPVTDCRNGKPNRTKTFLEDQAEYFQPEWEHVTDEGLNAREVLGKRPPW